MFIMVLIACVFLLLDRAEATVFERARDAATDAVTPVLEIFSGPVAAVREFLAGIQGYLAVHEELERLRDENETLRERVAEVEQLERRIDRYESMLTSPANPILEYATGRVVADDGGPFQRARIVNIGANDGVQRGQAAMDEHGLIGRIVGVGNGASRLLLVTDLNSRIPVFVEPAHRHAYLTGDNTELMRIEYIGDDEGIAAGDRIVTSGLGGLIPPGLPVGEISGKDGDFWRVESASRFDGIDYVRIYHFSVRNEIEDHGISLPSGAERIEPNEETGEIEIEETIEETIDGEQGPSGTGLTAEGEEG